MNPSTQASVGPASNDRLFYAINALLSSAALAFLAYILILREAAPTGGADLRFLPAVNAALNGTSAALLAAGWFAIRARNVRLHRALMVAAFVASALFLVCYLVYHWVHGDTRYAGEGLLRPLYFVILVSHIVLSIAVVPGALTAFYLAWRRQFRRHARVTRILLPIWLYVSVTGVVIFAMLRAAGSGAG